MMYKLKQSGFSAVELLITLFIASIFLMTGFQLYATIIKNGGEARQQSSATNVAADYLQKYESNTTSPCTPSTPLNGQAVTGIGLSNATVTVSITCPNIQVSSFSATGGNITKVNGYTIHTFTSSGTFTVANGSNNIDVLVVGGGGGGANTGAGGGAGGYVYRTDYKVTAGTPYTVTVGPGGASSAVPANNGFKGSNSVFNDITAEGGGYGTTHGAGVGGNGGSGGGGAIMLTGGGASGGTASNGNVGGPGFVDGGWVGGSGGGGGAGGAGYPGTNASWSGNGGAGISNSISGTAVTYAGGGGGGEVNGTYVGVGGGDIGGNAVANAAGGAGATNTGSGGAGGSFNAGTYNTGGAGGSGIVIVRYPTPNPTILTNVSKVVSTVTYGNSKTVSNSTYVSTPGIVTDGLALNLDVGSKASYPGSGNTWADLSPNGINGTLVGGVTYSAASNNGYLIFDGSTGYVNLASHPTNGPGSYSAFAWIKTGITGTRKSIIDWGSDATNGGVWLFINASNQVQMDLSGIGGPASTATVTNSAWHHVGVVNNANTIQIYVDGVASGSPLVMYPSIGITNIPRIGVGTGGNFGNWWYSGQMGNVVVYNKALSGYEITQNYNALRCRYVSC